MTNLYAYRATDPKDLKRAGYLVGPENDSYIEHAAKFMSVSGMVCAWGSNARGLSRPGDVLKLLRGAGVKPTALAVTDDGIPRHPLMLAYSCAPQPFGA